MTKADSAVAFSDKALAPPSPTEKTPATRVLWLLFDEMDQRMTFSARPPTLQLPEMDLLRSQANLRQQCLSPFGRDFALSARSSQRATGLSLQTARRRRTDDYLCRDQRGCTLEHSGQRVLEGPRSRLQSRNRGLVFSLLQNDHGQLTSCSWQLGPWDYRGMTVTECMVAQIHDVMEVTPFAGQLGLTP